MQSYGQWWLVVVNAGIFIVFAASFVKLKTGRDWKSFGAFAAFVVALFTEMYGFPLTLYVLSGWLQSKYPGVDLFAHNAGHLWETVFGLKGDPHMNILHIASAVLIGGGMILVAQAWDVLYKAQRKNAFAVTGPYKTIRHPQYAGFILVMIGFLLQWPTILTLMMFPILCIMYVRLARREEQEMEAQFGKAYAEYAVRTPSFIPRV